MNSIPIHFSVILNMLKKIEETKKTKPFPLENEYTKMYLLGIKDTFLSLYNVGIYTVFEKKMFMNKYNFILDLIKGK